jgi:hypothetical protein
MDKSARINEQGSAREVLLEDEAVEYPPRAAAVEGRLTAAKDWRKALTI